MLKQADFENVFWDLLFTYRQLLLNGNLHKRVNTEVYQKNPATWNTILLSLETGVVLGLAKLLEENYFGRKFDSQELNQISEKIINMRNSIIAHNDLSVMRNKKSFLEENQLTGTDIINMIDALKKRAIQYQLAFNSRIEVQKLFEETTRNAMNDLDNWLNSFRTPL
ncbi:MAG: hypothetical protein AAB421_00755 [Patescibacteria group bacterium]